MSKLLIAILLLAGTVFVFMQMRPTGKKLRTPQTQLGILNLEFAYDNDHTSKILNVWKANEKIAAAKINTYIDSIFLLFYAAFLFYSCKNLSKEFSGNTRNLGIWLSKAAMFAGALDAIENAGMFITLSGTQSSLIAIITTICASIKWLLAIVAILYIVFASAVALYFFLKEKPILLK